jgi:hypothetical protein
LPQVPRADSEAQHGGALAAHPALVVRRHARARGDLVERLGSGAVADGDERRAALAGKGQEARVEEVAELDGVFGREGREGEALGADVCIYQRLKLF